MQRLKKQRGQVGKKDMKNVWTVLLILLLTTGCEKEKVPENFNALYTGTFMRTYKNASEDPATAQVTLNFTETAYSGSSNMGHYPDICKGKFTISQTKINATTECMFTAEFDWTLIFSGEYDYDLKGDSLRIWRTYPDGSKDMYQLLKAE